MDVEWEAVTAGEGMWWPGLLSLVIMGDSVFTVLDDAVPGLKLERLIWGKIWSIYLFFLSYCMRRKRIEQNQGEKENEMWWL